MRNLIAIFIALTSAATLADDSTIASYRRARAVLDASIEAIGGTAKFEAFDDLTIDCSGPRSMINQSRLPEGPLEVEPSSIRLVLDRAHDRMLAESRSNYPGGSVFSYRWSLARDKGFVFDLLKNNQGSEAIALSGRGLDATRAGFARMTPHLALLDALHAAPTLRFVGRRGDDEGVSFVQPDGTLATLWIDEKSHLLESVEVLQDDGTLGDTVVANRFSDYTTVSGLRLPSRRVESLNDVVQRDLRCSYKLDVHPADVAFALPAGWTMPRPDAQPQPDVRELAPGVHIDTTNNNALVVELDDFVFTMEAANNSAAVEGVIANIKKIAPNKPIRYVALSHHHNDHAAGIRAYIAEGTTIIVPKMYERWVRTMAATKHTIAPDRLSREPREPKIEILEGHRTITDGRRTIELYDFGRNGHTDQLAYAWLPKERILFVPDMIFSPLTGQPSGAEQPPTAKELEARLKEQGIVPRIVIDPDGGVEVRD